MPLRVSCPGPLLRPACFGGGGPVPVPPYLAWGCGGGGRASPGGVPSTLARGVWGQALPLPRLPAQWAGCWGPRSTCCGRGRAGVGALLCPLGLHALWGLRAGGGSVAFVCRGAAGGGPVGRGVALPRSVPLPSLGRQQSGCHWRRAVHGGRGPPYHSGSCSPAFSGRDLCGVLARWRGLACSPRPPWEPAAGAGGWVALRLLSRAGGGPSPLPRGVGAGAPAACGPVGGRGGGWSRRGLPAPLLGGGLRYSILAPLVSSAHSLPACACVRGRSASPGWGGVRGGLWTTPPGAPADLNPPSALPEWAVVTGGSCGARPPYCSVARIAPARWRGLGPRPQPPREQVQPHPPPPPASRSLLRGGGASHRLRGGGGPLLWLPSSGGCGGGVGRPPPRPPAPSGVGLPSVAPGVPPRGILVPWGLPGGRGRRARSARPPTGQCGGGVGGEGGGTPPPWFAPPSSPGRPLIRQLCLRRPGRPGRRRSAVGWQQAGRVGACLGRGAPASRVQPPLRGGCGAAVSSVRLRPLLGLSGRGRGGVGGALWTPGDASWRPGGGAAWRARPLGQAIGWGVAPFPRPPLPRAEPSCRPLLGPLIPSAVVARRWQAGGGREG